MEEPQTDDEESYFDAGQESDEQDIEYLVRSISQQALCPCDSLVH